MKTSELRNAPNDELIALLCLLMKNSEADRNSNISKICNELKRRGIIEDTFNLYNMLI